jgi:phosphomannomutase
MAETDAVIGGESSGGLAVRGHISGKDGIYAAALLVEMLAVTGKSVSELYSEIAEQYGDPAYEEADFTMSEERKLFLTRKLFEEKNVPDFHVSMEKISYEDGVKTYFTDGSWVICRFSGTEPLLRMAAEADDANTARNYIEAWRKLLCL